MSFIFKTLEIVELRLHILGQNKHQYDIKINL